MDRAEYRTVDGWHGKGTNVEHNIFICPKGILCESRKNIKREYASQKIAGYYNPFRHLLTCYAQNNIIFLLGTLVESRSLSTGTISQYLTSEKVAMDHVKPREQANYEYIRLLASSSLPLNRLGKENFRSISKHQYRFGIRYIREVIFKLVAVVESKIGSEFRETKVSIKILRMVEVRDAFRCIVCRLHEQIYQLRVQEEMY